MVEPSGALEETHPLRLHNARRLVHVPMHASAHAIAQFLGVRGTLGAAQMAAQADALDAARRHTGAKRLRADHALSDGQVMAACTRLRALAPRPSGCGVLDRLSVLIALSFSAETSGEVKVRWDFDE